MSYRDSHSGSPGASKAAGVLSSMLGMSSRATKVVRVGMICLIVFLINLVIFYPSTRSTVAPVSSAPNTLLLPAPPHRLPEGDAAASEGTYTVLMLAYKAPKELVTTLRSFVIGGLTGHRRLDEIVVHFQSFAGVADAKIVYDALELQFLDSFRSRSRNGGGTDGPGYEAQLATAQTVLFGGENRELYSAVLFQGLRDSDNEVHFPKIRVTGTTDNLPVGEAMVGAMQQVKTPYAIYVEVDRPLYTFPHGVASHTEMPSTEARSTVDRRNERLRKTSQAEMLLRSRGGKPGSLYSSEKYDVVTQDIGGFVRSHVEAALAFLWNGRADLFRLQAYASPLNDFRAQVSSLKVQSKRALGEGDTSLFLPSDVRFTSASDVNLVRDGFSLLHYGRTAWRHCRTAHFYNSPLLTLPESIQSQLPKTPAGGLPGTCWHVLKSNIRALMGNVFYTAYCRHWKALQPPNQNDFCDSMCAVEWIKAAKQHRVETMETYSALQDRQRSGSAYLVTDVEADASGIAPVHERERWYVNRKRNKAAEQWKAADSIEGLGKKAEQTMWYRTYGPESFVVDSSADATGKGEPVLLKRRYRHDVMCMDCEMCNWSNQPAIYRVQWFMDNIAQRYLKSKLRFSDTSGRASAVRFENFFHDPKDWMSLHHRICFSEGLFVHHEQH